MTDKKLKANSGNLQLGDVVTVDQTNSRLGIGTSSPSERLHVNSTIICDAGSGYSVKYTDNRIAFNRPTLASYIDQEGVGGSLFFRVSNSTTSDTTAIQLTSAGAVTLGPSTGAAVSHTLWSSYATTTDNTSPLLVKSTGSASSQRYLQFYYNSTTAAGGLRRATTTQSIEFFSGSDRRLKENIEDADPVLNRLLNVKIRKYNFKGEQGSARGVIAQELIEQFPEKVEAPDDGLGDVLPEGQQAWTVGESWHYELIQAIQELNAKVEALEAQLTS